MSQESARQLSRRQWSKTCFGRALFFVGIVWSIAGAFLLLQLGLPELVDQIIKAGWVPAELAMPTPSRTDVASNCADITAGSDTAATTDPAVLQGAAYATWRLGFTLGFAAAAASAGIASDGHVAELMEEPQALAKALGVEAPSLPDIQHIANALYEFSVYVEADAQCVAATLAKQYTPRYGPLYKLGSVIGHATLHRIGNPQGGALFVSQIRRYGQLAEVPQDLWLPMTQESLDSLPGADAREKTLTLVSRIEEYVRVGK